jgi:nucleoside-diphosphate-sugar epimerase
MPLSLVTGGAGFSGSHVVDEWVGRGHQVMVLDDLSGGFPETAVLAAVEIAKNMSPNWSRPAECR